MYDNNNNVMTVLLSLYAHAIVNKPRSRPRLPPWIGGEGCPSPHRKSPALPIHRHIQDEAKDAGPTCRPAAPPPRGTAPRL